MLPVATSLGACDAVNPSHAALAISGQPALDRERARGGYGPAHSAALCPPQRLRSGRGLAGAAGPLIAADALFMRLAFRLREMLLRMRHLLAESFASRPWLSRALKLCLGVARS